MFKVFFSLLLTASFLVFNSCEKEIVDSGIPQMYILNLNFHLEDQNPLDNLKIEDIKNSITPDIKDQRAAFDAEFFTFDGERYLRLITSAIPPLELDKTSYSIKNKSLFGDDKEHLITVEWLKENNNRKILKASVNGNQLKIEQGKNFDYFIIAN